MGNLIKKDSSLLIIYVPKRIEIELVAEMHNYISKYCDDDVFPLLIHTDNKEFKVEMVNCQNLTNEQSEKLINKINNILKNI